MKLIRHYLITLILLYSATGEAREVARTLDDVASILGGSAAEVTSRGLLAEHTRVIFLDVRGCVVDAAESSRICDRFLSAFRLRIQRAGIRYLSESAAAGIRDKIASEQLYQQRSLNVDPRAAVALGEQQAFQAFVSLSLSGDMTRLVAEVQSTSIREGAVTLTETLVSEQESADELSSGQIAKGWGGLLVGASLALWSAKKASASRDFGDRAFARYKIAENPDEAVAARREVEKSDRSTYAFTALELAGAVVTAIAGTYLAVAGRPILHFEILPDVVSGNRPGQPLYRGYSVGAMISK